MVSSVGSIVILKGIIFKTDGREKHYIIDHAYKKGRPALVIHETEDAIYHLLITTKNADVPDFYDYELLIDKRNGINGYVKFNEIHKRPLCYEEEIYHLSDEEMIKILKGLCLFQNTCGLDDEYEYLKPIIENKIDELNKNKVLCLKREDMGE